MRWIRTFGVRRCDQRSGFQDPAPNNIVPSSHFHNDGVFELPNRGVTPWLVASCHLSAQYGCIDSFEDCGLLVSALVH